MGPEPLAKLQPLHDGDTIGLVCPASPIGADSVKRAETYLERHGYRVKRGKHLSKPFLCDLSGTDEERLADFNGFLTDPEVRAIVCLRGGYGSPRLLDRIDYDALARAPKLIAGFSDVTAIHLAVYRRTGLVSLHAPALGYTFGTKSLKKFTERAWWSMFEGTAIPGPALFVDAADWSGRKSLETWKPGTAEGVLLGGNLSMLAALEGTLYSLPKDVDIVLFLEETGEPAYRVDRMLTQLHLAGSLSRVKGVLLGGFSVPRGKPTERPMIDGVLRDRLGVLGVPILKGVPIGHQSYNMTVAHGARVVLDTKASTLVYLDDFFGRNP